MRRGERLRDPRHWQAIALVLLVLGTGWTWVTRVPASAAFTGRPPSPHVGFPAPDFVLRTLGGGATALSQQRGKVVVVNLWASWCGPCRLEMPVIEKVYVADRSRGLVVLAVNATYQNSEAAAQHFAQELGLSFPILLDSDSTVSRLYLLRALPSTYIVDRKGIVRTVIIGGPMTEALLRSKVEPLLAEAP
jgi:thiol-disulfide isomerase/thioredoxin